jgi:hypothetical protein
MEKPSILIGFTGHKQHGKSFAQNILWTHFNNVVKMSFAEPLKRCAEALFDRECNIDWEKKDIRDLLKAIGTGVRNELYQDFWVDLQKGQIRKYLRECKVPILADVRYRNEAACIRNEGGRIYRIIDPNMLSNVDLHPSEVEQDSIRVDAAFVNNKNSRFEVELLKYFTPILQGEEVNAHSWYEE